MKITINKESAVWPDTTHDSILQALDNERVFKINRQAPDEFALIECCDEYFALVLTREQLLGLADELRDLANKP